MFSNQWNVTLSFSGNEIYNAPLISQDVVRAWKDILGTWDLNEIRCGIRKNAKLLDELKG